MSQALGGTVSALTRRGCVGLRLPVGAKEQLLDPIGVQKIVERQMPEHDEHGIHPILTVVGGSRPVGGRSVETSANRCDWYAKCSCSSAENRLTGEVDG